MQIAKSRSSRSLFKMQVYSKFLLTELTAFQDERGRNEALRSLEDNTSKIKKEKAKVEEYEISLAKEENVLEEIRDSLKGACEIYIIYRLILTIPRRQDSDLP